MRTNSYGRYIMCRTSAGQPGLVCHQTGVNSRADLNGWGSAAFLPAGQIEISRIQSDRSKHLILDSVQDKPSVHSSSLVLNSLMERESIEPSMGLTVDITVPFLQGGSETFSGGPRASETCSTEINAGLCQQIGHCEPRSVSF